MREIGGSIFAHGLDAERGTAERSAGRPERKSSFGELMATLVLTSENSIPAEAVAAVPAARFRIESVDFLRGVVMILMALDHTRDFPGVNTISPTDLGTPQSRYSSPAGYLIFAPRFSFCSRLAMPSPWTLARSQLSSLRRPRSRTA